MERKLFFIRAELVREGIEIPSGIDINPRAPMPREIIDLEAQIERDESEIHELAENSSMLQKNHAELSEFKSALEWWSTMDSYSPKSILADIDEPSEGPLDFVIGLIARDKFMAFERMLYRVSRGNIFIRRHEVEQPFKDVKSVSRSGNDPFSIF